MNKQRLQTVEEDGDEIFTPMPVTCPVPRWLRVGQAFRECGGAVRVIDGFHQCERCRASFGPAEPTTRPEGK